jgi:predicted Ser/Thr protein kinase
MDSHQKKDITNKDHVKYTLHLDKELGKGMFGKVYKANYAPGQQFDAHGKNVVHFKRNLRSRSFKKLPSFHKEKPKQIRTS